MRQAKADNYNLFYTGDESWFYLNSYYERQWLPSDKKPPERIKQKIDSKKDMLTIFWNPNCFLLVEALDDNRVFNADYFIGEILEQIVIKTNEDREKIKKQLVLHYDNAGPHTAKKVREYLTQNDIQRAPQPPYSPDLAPSDFYLFGHIKTQLQGFNFSSVDELLSQVHTILARISETTLQKAFTNWEHRLEQVISTKGNYYD